MNQRGFHKTCNPMARKFYEDFDLLPREVKELLWYGDRMPNLEDLKEAWKLAEELYKQKGNPVDLLKLNCFEKERKEQNAAQKKAEKERKWAERALKRNEKFKRMMAMYKLKNPKTTATYKISGEQAVELLTTRAENKDIRVLGSQYDYREIKPNEEVGKPRGLPITGLGKAFHNG